MTARMSSHCYSRLGTLSMVSETSWFRRRRPEPQNICRSMQRDDRGRATGRLGAEPCPQAGQGAAHDADHSGHRGHRREGSTELVSRVAN